MFRPFNSAAVILAFLAGGVVCARTQALPTSAPADLPSVDQSRSDSPAVAQILPNAPVPAQSFSSSAAATDDATRASAESPDAPRSGSAVVSPQYPTSHPDLHRVVPPERGPQPLTSGQKLELSLIAPMRPMSFGANFISAGWSHLNDTRPHYGTDKAGFGERLGATKVKQMGENFFSYGLFASAFHEDPHYYVMGRGHSIKERAVYSASRVILTRKDDGNTGVNWAKLAGIVASNALVNAYYPDRDRGFKPSATAVLTNIGSTAMTLELDEFLPDALKIIGHKSR